MTCFDVAASVNEIKLVSVMVKDVNLILEILIL